MCECRQSPVSQGYVVVVFWRYLIPVGNIHDNRSRFPYTLKKKKELSSLADNAPRDTALPSDVTCEVLGVVNKTPQERMCLLHLDVPIDERSRGVEVIVKQPPVSSPSVPVRHGGENPVPAHPDRTEQVQQDGKAIGHEFQAYSSFTIVL